MIGYLGFSVEEVYMGKGVTSGEACGPHTTCSRAGRWGHAARLCGSLVAPLRLSFGVRVCDGNVRSRVFVPCNSKNISYVIFLKPKKAENRQLALWHLVNRLVAENAIKCK